MKAYPAILENTTSGYSLYFPDLPSSIFAGRNYEDTIENAKECLSLHLQGMLQDKEPIPLPSHIADIITKLEKGNMVALIEIDMEFWRNS